MNRIDQSIQDSKTLLMMLIEHDRWAVAALERKDDLALLRRIAKAPIEDALSLAIERALMRGHGDHAIAKALGITRAELNHHIAAIYAALNPSTRA